MEDAVLTPPICIQYSVRHPILPEALLFRGTAQLDKLDGYHFEFKGTVIATKNASASVVPSMGVSTTLDATLPEYSGNYVLSNAGQLRIPFFDYTRGKTPFVAGVLPAGDSTTLYHENGEADILQIGTYIQAGQGGAFDILISTTPTPEPATAALMGLAFTGVALLAWRGKLALRGLSPVPYSPFPAGFR